MTDMRIVVATTTAIGVAIGLTWGGWLRVDGDAELTVTRFKVPVPAGLDETFYAQAQFALAPDGQSIVYSSNGRLNRRSFADFESTPIPGTEGGRDVIYSPDAQWIAYAVGTELFKRPIVGGSRVRLAENVDGGTVGMAWLDDGTILYEQTITGTERPRRIVLEDSASSIRSC